MLKVENLSKRYKGASHFAVKDVSFELNQGEIVGLIGGNGAGKTTIMKMIAKSIKPSAGMVKVKNQDIFKKDNMLKNINFMIEPVFFTHLTAFQNIQFYLKVNEQDASLEQIKAVMNLVGLWEARNKKPKTFSFGMKQRLGLAMCIAAEPEVVIMDEPFVGLDPNGVDALIKRLKDWAKTKDMSILVSSHQLSELEAISDRYIYIENGKLKKTFDKSTLNSTVLYLKKPIEKGLVNRDDVVVINESVIRTYATGDSFNQLIAKLSNQNVILKIEQESDLREIFKGEIK